MSEVPCLNPVSRPVPGPAPRLALPKPWLIAVAGLLLAFGLPLFELIRFSLGSELFSHLGLVPLASAFMVWTRRLEMPAASAPDPRLAIAPFLGGVAALIAFWSARLSGVTLPIEDSLALTTLSFVLLFTGVCGLFLGRATFRFIGFPLAFLVLMAPMPVFLTNWIEGRLQHGSAEVAMLFFDLSGTAVFRQDLIFQLPTITLEVAPECSGIHSSLALFIVSLVAGYLYLRSPWKRAVLTLAIVPLSFLRNGFRVFTIGELCVRIGPDMIDSFVHHRGGPIFFALSLVPFSILLYLLVRSDRVIRAN
jgi:exosortase C (VPDSG-CTERM-specific)